MPPGQLVHILEDVAADALENLPRTHKLHSADPVVLLNLPATHSEQAKPLVPLCPALHIQFVTWLLPTTEFVFTGHAAQVDDVLAPFAVENLPASHGMHSAAPLTSLYVPAMHSEQGLPLGPVESVMHVQAVTALLPVDELECAGQAVHVET